VIETILEHGVAAVGQRAGDAKVRHVTRGEQQRSLASREFRERFLECVVFAMMAGDQVGRTAAYPVVGSGLREGLCDSRVLGESQVVVGAEHQRLASVHDLPCAARATFDDAATTVESGRAQGVERGSGVRAHPGPAGCRQPP
jgi:hypothetical protein